MTITQSDASSRLREHVEQFAPRIEWDDFIAYEFDWRQGQHIGLIGPTGSGKTTLALAILPIRRYIVVLATKPRDETLTKFGRRNGFHVYNEWHETSPTAIPRRLIWPDAKSLYSASRQRYHFQRALQAIYKEGNWCVYIDELWFIIHHLKLDLEVRTYLQQARSNGISLVAATQRPAFVPLEVYDQSTHLFFWRDTDERNLSRISGISWHNANYVRQLVANLDPHEVLYVNTVTGRMLRTTAPEGM